MGEVLDVKPAQIPVPIAESAVSSACIVRRALQRGCMGSIGSWRPCGTGEVCLGGCVGWTLACDGDRDALAAGCSVGLPRG